jgi:serine/threonine protein kinase KIN1/2
MCLCPFSPTLCPTRSRPPSPKIHPPCLTSDPLPPLPIRGLCHRVSAMTAAVSTNPQSSQTPSSRTYTARSLSTRTRPLPLTTDSPQRAASASSHSNKPFTFGRLERETSHRHEHDTPDVVQHPIQQLTRDQEIYVDKAEPTLSRHHRRVSTRSGRTAQSPSDMPGNSAPSNNAAHGTADARSSGTRHSRSRTTIPTQSGKWILGKTIGAGSMGKVKLARKEDGSEQVH